MTYKMEKFSLEISDLGLNLCSHSFFFFLD